MAPLILASSSLARQRMLAAAGVEVVLRPHQVDEAALQRSTANLTPRRMAALLARTKAEDVARREPAAIVIGADQTLDLDGRTFAKPKDRADAARHLRQLSGRTHRLHSAFAIAGDGAILTTGVRSARLTMRRLGHAELDAYLDQAGDAATASVGAYQVEGLGIRLFDRIDGDFFTILGLPLLPLIAALRRLGAIA